MCLIKEKQKSTTHTIKDWRSFAFSKLKSLGKITQIEHIESQCFKDFTNLLVLEFVDNKLTEIKSNSFQHLNKLKKLNLIFNQIEQINSNGFQGLDNLEVR